MGMLRLIEDDVDALAGDGRMVHLRELGPDDLPALVALHERASDTSIQLRYLGAGRPTTVTWMESALTPDAGRCTLGAYRNETLVGTGTFERTGDCDAEFALLVEDAVQHTGVGTLLLEHLVAEARGRGIERLIGDVLAGNNSMLRVIRDMGLPISSTFDSGVVHVEIDLDVDDQIVDAISSRDQVATRASLQALLAPRSLVVVGAGQRPGSVGHEVLRNVLGTGFPGAVYAINPNRNEVLGVRCYPTAADLPDTPDLAVVALPAPRVADAVADLGARGVRAAVLLGSGFGEAGAAGAALQDRVLEVARRSGMRLVGPNCIGIVNTDPRVRLNATFAALAPMPGRIGLLAQSGAFGVGLLSGIDRSGTGIAQFVSIGNKIDVGGNDLLLAWEQDDRVRVVCAYLESVGDPRRFARIARRVAQRKPVLVVKSGRTEVGRQAGRSHTAAAATSEVAVEALFRSSGALRVGSMREMLDAARVLADTPLPPGPRVAVVGNSGGPEILAADAASDAGLTVVPFDDDTRAALAAHGLPTQNPLDLGAAVTPEQARAALDIVAGSPLVDAVITVFTEVAITDPKAMDAAIVTAAARADMPFVAVSVGARPATLELPGSPWRLPVFTFPEEAAAALGTAFRYAQLRARPPHLPLRPPDVDADGAREIVDRALARGTDWLPAEEAFDLLVCYGIPVAPYAVVSSVEQARDAAHVIGFPVAAKIAAAGAHKTELGGVRLGLANAAQLDAAVRGLAALGDRRVLLQAMARGGTELIVGSVHDAQCGPLVMIGAGGILTDVLADRSFALAPLTDSDADALVSGLRSARLLDGYRGAPVVDRRAVREVLVRVAALVDDIPEIAELDINPLIANEDGVVAVDTRVRLAPPPPSPDPLVRRLRGPRHPQNPRKENGHD